MIAGSIGKLFQITRNANLYRHEITLVANGSQGTQIRSRQHTKYRYFPNSTAPAPGAEVACTQFNSAVGKGADLFTILCDVYADLVKKFVGGLARDADDFGDFGGFVSGDYYD